MATRTTASRRRARTRAKISTTVAVETHTYLHQMVSRGQARTLADALDLLARHHIEEERRAELDRRMTDYYESLTDDQVSDEQRWGSFAEGEMAGTDRP